MKMLWLVVLLSVYSGLTGCKETKDNPKTEISAQDSAELTEVVVKVDGMTCGSCEYHIDHGLKKMNGVVDCKADSDKGEAIIKYLPSKTNINDIIASIGKLGYTANVQ